MLVIVPKMTSLLFAQWGDASEFGHSMGHYWSFWRLILNESNEVTSDRIWSLVLHFLCWIHLDTINYCSCGSLCPCSLLVTRLLSHGLKVIARVGEDSRGTRIGIDSVCCCCTNKGNRRYFFATDKARFSCSLFGTLYMFFVLVVGFLFFLRCAQAFLLWCLGSRICSLYFCPGLKFAGFTLS